MFQTSSLASILSLGSGHVRTLAVIVMLAASCAIIQKVFRRELERDQYYYLRDICLIASWALCGIWTQSSAMKLSIAAGVISGLVGFCQRVIKGWDLRFCYLAVGFGVALLGPRIAFIGDPEGEFLYLASPITIMVLSTLWISFFPILFQEIDEIPGMGGSFLLVAWSLMLAVTILTSTGLSDAMVMSLCGVAMILVFWSRHVNVYRRLGSPLAAMWGALLAGTSILGASRGIAFAPVMVLPIGLFAIPVLEILISVLSAALSPKPVEVMAYYRALVSGGTEHPTAVYVVTASCAICGMSAVLIYMGAVDTVSLIIALVIVLIGVYALYSSSASSPEHSEKRPELWGVSVDNFSLDYALGRVSGWISADAPSQIIVTPDALAALMSRRDRRYAGIVSRAGLVIPDGAGLVWAMRSLGYKIREKISGVDFVDHLCRVGAARGWPVYLLGGKPGIAEKAAKKLEERHKGLIVAGARDGYFKPEESAAISQVIKDSGAKIVFVALGVPKQEYWIDENKDRMGRVVAMGVGGSFDVISGTLKRAPKKWRDMKLEWLYRTIQEPYRWRRVIKLPLFVLLVMLKKAGLDTRSYSGN